MPGNDVISEKKKALLAYKEQILQQIKYYDKRIDDIRTQGTRNSFFENVDSSDSEDEISLTVNCEPSVGELRQEQAMLKTRLQATQELTSLQVLQSEVNVLVDDPEFEGEPPVKEPGVWREVTAECRVNLVPFSITFYVHQPDRKFGPPSYRGLRVAPVKTAHEGELGKSVLPTVTRPSDAVEVLRSFASAQRARRASLARLADKFANTLYMEPMPEGGYKLKCADLLELSWTLQNKWSPVAPFHHRMKFDLEYMDESYIKTITAAHRQLSDPSLSPDERTLLLARIITTCLEARGPTQEVNESMSSEGEAAEAVRGRCTTLDGSPRGTPPRELMAPPRAPPKRAKPKGKENMTDNQRKEKLKRQNSDEDMNSNKKLKTDAQDDLQRNDDDDDDQIIDTRHSTRGKSVNPHDDASNKNNELKKTSESVTKNVGSVKSIAVGKKNVSGKEITVTEKDRNNELKASKSNAESAGNAGKGTITEKVKSKGKTDDNLKNNPKTADTGKFSKAKSDLDNKTGSKDMVKTVHSGKSDGNMKSNAKTASSGNANKAIIKEKSDLNKKAGSKIITKTVDSGKSDENMKSNTKTADSGKNNRAINKEKSDLHKKAGSNVIAKTVDSGEIDGNMKSNTKTADSVKTNKFINKEKSDLNRKATTVAKEVAKTVDSGKSDENIKGIVKNAESNKIGNKGKLVREKSELDKKADAGSKEIVKNVDSNSKPKMVKEKSNEMIKSVANVQKDSTKNIADPTKSSKDKTDDGKVQKSKSVAMNKDKKENVGKLTKKSEKEIEEHKTTNSEVSKEKPSVNAQNTADKAKSVANNKNKDPTKIKGTTEKNMNPKQNIEDGVANKKTKESTIKVTTDKNNLNARSINTKDTKQNPAKNNNEDKKNTLKPSNKDSVKPVSAKKVTNGTEPTNKNAPAKSVASVKNKIPPNNEYTSKENTIEKVVEKRKSVANRKSNLIDRIDVASDKTNAKNVDKIISGNVTNKNAVKRKNDLNADTEVEMKRKTYSVDKKISSDTKKGDNYQKTTKSKIESKMRTKLMPGSIKTLAGNTKFLNAGTTKFSSTGNIGGDKNSKIPQKKLSAVSEATLKKNPLRISPRKIPSKFKTTVDGAKFLQKTTNIPRLLKKPISNA